MRGLGGRGWLIAPVLVASALTIGIFRDAKHVETPRQITLSEAQSKLLLAELKGASFVFYVIQDGAIVRESPNTSTRILKKEIRGAQIDVLSRPGPGPWVQVRDGNIEGWMRADELGPDRP